MQGHVAATSISDKITRNTGHAIGTKLCQKTRGIVLQGHVVTTSASDTIIRGTYEGNMCQGVVADVCAWHIIAIRTLTR